MEKSKNKNTAKHRKVAKNRIPHMTSTKFTVDKLLQKVDENIDRFLYDVADKFCERALILDPDDLRALETGGFLKLELGQYDAAIDLFTRAVSLSPDIGHMKYMYLGQLHQGHEAVANFQKGLDILLKRKHDNAVNAPDDPARDPGMQVTDTDISTAYCSLAELYLTDLCFDENADVKCKENATKAIESDVNNSEAYRIMADCLMSLEDTDGARDMIKKSVGLWMDEARLQDSEGASSVECGQNDDYNPVRVTRVPYESRVNSAKILIELEEYDLSSDVLEMLLDENDSVTEVWYLLGWLNYLQGVDYLGNARFYLTKARKVHTTSADPDLSVLSHIDELLTELGPGEGDENDDEDGDVEAEVTIDTDSDDGMDNS